MTTEGEGGTRAIIAAFLANLGIAIIKFVAFLFTGASSMLAESIHSVADTGNQGLLVLGGRRSRRDPTPKHPFGYGRERYFAAFLVAVVLFTVGGLFALWEGYEKLRHPHELESPVWAFAVLFVAIALEGFSLRTAVREGNRVRGSLSWWMFIRRSKSPEIPVVLLEDVGALCGLLFALTGITLAVVTGNSRFDALGSLAIGVLLVVIAVIVGVEMRSLLLGESASRTQVEAISAALAGAPGVHRVIHLRTMHLGPDELLVGAKLAFAPDLTVRELSEVIDGAEERVRARVPAAHLMYLEPDIYHEDAADPPAAADPPRATSREP
ncbi:MAG TPA: cation diffusion facilitator family transporter [Actinomycetes bacterium]|nr:cation diffusion facilitator family transporter [Actinomycetes bacterium]